MKLKSLYYNLAIVLVLLLAACSGRSSSGELLSIETFSPILVDALLVEARLQSVEAPKRDSVGSQLYLTIWENHAIDEETFYYNLEYYTERPEEALELYEQVLDFLNKREAEYSLPLQDSI